VAQEAVAMETMEIPASDAALHERFQDKLSRWDLARRGRHAPDQPDQPAEGMDTDDEGGGGGGAAAGGGGAAAGGGARAKGTLTPLEKQVVALKAAHPGVVLLVEVGYKYHLYGTPDAEVAAKVHNASPACE
jgi:hypothetical protein